MQAIELATTISEHGGITLPANFKALYGREARIIVLLDDVPPTAPTVTNRTERQATLRHALAAVAQAGTFAHIDDAAAWQREMRTERTQPGRED
jgi:hypothetical protein